MIGCWVCVGPVSINTSAKKIQRRFRLYDWKKGTTSIAKSVEATKEMDHSAIYLDQVLGHSQTALIT